MEINREIAGFSACKVGAGWPEVIVEGRAEAGGGWPFVGDSL